MIFSLLNVIGKRGKSCLNTRLLSRSYFDNEIDLTFAKGKPKPIFCHCYKKSVQNSFSVALQNKISQPDLLFKKFIKIFQSNLGAFAPCKQKKVRFNNNSFMTERLRKEIMIRSKLRNAIATSAD